MYEQAQPWCPMIVLLMCQSMADLKYGVQTVPSAPRSESQSLDLSWLVRALVLFAPWANCVYYCTFFGLLSAPQQWNKQDAYQNHYSQVWKAVTFICVTFRPPALSHLLAHFGWVGEICGDCRCLPAWPLGLMEHVLWEGDSNWQGLYIILREKGVMTINQ